LTRILAALLLIGLSSPAAAHLITANKGTVSVKDRNIYVVLSVPVAALKDFDDNADKRIDAAELGRHAGNLRAQIEARVRLTADGAAAVEGLTFVVSPLTDDHDQDATDYVVAMIAQRFDAAPRTVELWTDLFGKSKADRSISLIASRDGVEETAMLSPKRSKHRFFK
jgi:hypothetical protein